MDGVPRDSPRSSAETSRGDAAAPLGEVHGSAMDEGSKFQKAIAAWRNIDLTNLIPKLDTTASDLVAHQRDALVERKELAQKTKDFRKLDEDSKLAEIKSLLKSYQGYIDLVSNQNKTVSSSFLNFYSSLSEAPDPYPLLEASIDSLVVADETVPRLEAENKSLQWSNKRLSCQLEALEKQLNEERSARQQAEENRDVKVRQVEESWSAVLTEKEDNWAARERSLEERTENQERLLKELKASYEVSQRMDRGQESETQSVNGTSAAELEMMHSDLDRANARLADVEARNEQLRLQLAQSATQSGARQSAQVEDDPSYIRLRSENSSLLRKIDSTKFERDSERREVDTTLRGLRRDLSVIKEDNDKLKAKVQKWSDYEDVKTELEVLKSIEFATGENEEDEGHSNMEKKEQNLEQLLMARNKKLNEDLTVLRVSHQELNSRFETLQDDLSNTNMELERSRNLTATLETDMERLQQEATNTFPAASVAGTYSSRYPKSNKKGGRGSPTSSIISGFDNQGTLESLRAGETAAAGGSGILPMVTAQRDRFKKRIKELEAELSKNYQTVSALRAEVSSLQKDNLNLYEKTRYVNSSFNRGQHTSSSASHSTNPNPSAIQIGGASPIDRYHSAYESRISPFAAFRGRESARALKRMSLPERAIFQITRMILQTRTSRNLFGLYCLALHMMVFGMLFYTGSATVDQQVVHMAESVANNIGERAEGGSN
ncbi:hypothetical protein FH972_026885 [Carpinus fangiana]|uniref:Protein CASP n=1 Tax=Carpinus fangiana TaxID=176857 RepID=A0A5N6L652_9ROSI|nr:hypothetical protein FH972_026885 [Carpinus fangiana]